MLKYVNKVSSTFKKYLVYPIIISEKVFFYILYSISILENKKIIL